MKSKSIRQRSCNPLRMLRWSFYALSVFLLWACATEKVEQGPLGLGWAKNSINTTIFRKNSITSLDSVQCTAFYNPEGYVVLAKRQLGDTLWEQKTTTLRGNVRDAHNGISLMLDGQGYLHMAWDHHNTTLHYAKSIAPFSLELESASRMTGSLEDKVAYPQFFRFPNGDLLFLYRDGSAGKGNLVLNRYALQDASWTQLQKNLIDGEDTRNAYWQACLDAQGGLHLSWVWREEYDVASNHGICYAYSVDGGRSWQRSNGTTYSLPITAKSAEYVINVPQNHELINQTSMCVDHSGTPYIASYWRDTDATIPQFRLVYKDRDAWKMQQISQRKTPFRLSGIGTKKIPISRPQILCASTDTTLQLFMLFSDVERGSKVSLLSASKPFSTWTTEDLTSYSVGDWEPSYDTELWKSQQKLHIFVQIVAQGDAETLSETPPQPVNVLEWHP